MLVTGKCHIQSPYNTLGNAEQQLAKCHFKNCTHNVWIGQRQRSVYYLVVDNNAGVKGMCRRMIYASLIQLWISAWLGHMRDQSNSAWPVVFHGDFSDFPKHNTCN